MITFNTKKTVQSKVSPEVQFTIKVMTAGVRNRLRASLALQVSKLRDYQSELESIDLPKLATGELDRSQPIEPATMARVLTLNDQIDFLIRSEINSAYFKAAFVSIDGIAVDDQAKVTTETGAELLPENVYMEIVDAVRAEAELTNEERENLGSPTTSAAQVDGQSSASIAASVDETNSTSPVTVTSSSQS